MRVSFLQLIIVTALLASVSYAQDKNHPGKVRVQIQIIADSSNSLQANVEAPVGAPARDLMERLFKMSYVDFGRKFVNGIAGFAASPKEKEFWRLEIDGKDSEVGIADIKIDRAMMIRWVITKIK